MVYAWCFFRQQVSEIKRRAKKKKKFKKKKKKGRKTELPNIGRFVKAAIYTIGALRYMCSSLWISTRMSRCLRNWSRLQVKLLESVNTFKRTQFLTYFWSMHRYYIIRGSKMRKKEKKVNWVWAWSYPRSWGANQRHLFLMSTYSNNELSCPWWGLRACKLSSSQILWSPYMQL